MNCKENILKEILREKRWAQIMKKKMMSSTIRCWEWTRKMWKN
jgi:hypothetical protein